MIATIISLVTTLVVGIATVPIVNAIKRLSTTVDATPAFVKQVIVTVVALLLTTLSGLLNVVLPTELAQIQAGDVQALLAAAIAFGVYAAQGKLSPAVVVAPPVA